MKLDQTEEESDLGPYCLQYRLPKYIILKLTKITELVVSGWKRLTLH